MKEFAPKENIPVERSTFNPKGYPEEYLESFSQPDEEVVAGFLTHLQTKESEVGRIMTEIHPDGAEVYTQVQSGENVWSQGINWSDPTKYPKDYWEYARTFYSFKGPTALQINRGEMLAESLNIEHKVVDKRPVVQPPQTLLQKFTTIFQK